MLWLTLEEAGRLQGIFWPYGRGGGPGSQKIEPHKVHRSPQKILHASASLRSMQVFTFCTASFSSAAIPESRPAESQA